MKTHNQKLILEQFKILRAILKVIYIYVIYSIYGKTKMSMQIVI